MLEPATGTALIALVVAYLVLQSAVTWLLLRDSASRERTLLLLLPFAVAPFLGNFPVALVTAWLLLDVALIARRSAA